jgi:hypothetical protein
MRLKAQNFLSRRALNIRTRVTATTIKSSRLASLKWKLCHSERMKALITCTRLMSMKIKDLIRVTNGAQQGSDQVAAFLHIKSTALRSPLRKPKTSR